MTSSKFCIVVVIMTVCGLFVRKCEMAKLKDIWTKERKESYRVCRDRLPDPISDADLEWVSNQPRMYIKYSDQVTFSRYISLLAGGPNSEQPVSKIRCLFESPCMITDFQGVNSSTTGCTGVKIFHELLPQPNGILDAYISYPDGTPAYTVIVVPAFTDRKSFVIHINCFEDGTLGFSVASIRPALSAFTRHVIKEFLDHSGFADNFRIVTNFMSTSCEIRL